MNRRKLLLLRHPEAQKNIEDRHGGKGTSLTIKGVQQCKSIAKYILNEFSPLSNCKLIGHHIPQVEESIKHISNILVATPEWDERLRGIDLGVIAGFSREEAAHKWPDVAERLELWRKGKLRIDQLDLLGAESLDIFKKRVESILNDWLRMYDEKLIIAVCTRSVLIMLVNLINLKSNFNYQDYKAYDFKAGSITLININDSVPEVVILKQIKGFIYGNS